MNRTIVARALRALLVACGVAVVLVVVVDGAALVIGAGPLGVLLPFGAVLVVALGLGAVLPRIDRAVERLTHHREVTPYSALAEAATRIRAGSLDEALPGLAQVLADGTGRLPRGRVARRGRPAGHGRGPASGTGRRRARDRGEPRRPAHARRHRPRRTRARRHRAAGGAGDREAGRPHHAGRPAARPGRRERCGAAAARGRAQRRAGRPGAARRRPGRGAAGLAPAPGQCPRGGTQAAGHGALPRDDRPPRRAAHRGRRRPRGPWRPFGGRARCAAGPARAPGSGSTSCSTGSA